MSLNFLGLGFNFGSKDSGLGRNVKKLTRGFDGMERSFDRAAERALDRSPRIAEGVGLIERAVRKLDQILSVNRLQAWLASFSLARLNNITDGLKELADNINLTTPLESTFTANIKATKAMAANMGYVGKEAKKFSSQAASMAYGMNISTDNAGKATYAMDTWGKALKAVGIDSKETAAKVQEVFGLDVNKFGNQLATLQKEFGFTDKQLNNLVGGLQAFGTQNGDVKGTLEKLPGLIEQVRKKATSLGKTLSADELADYAAQTTELAAGFYAFSADTEYAQKQADAISTALIEANVNIGKMFAGTEQDLGKFASGLGIATGDIEKSFKLMKKGPAGFVKGLAGMISDMGGFSKMTGEQTNFIQKQLMEAMGPDAGQMVFEFFQKADASTLKAMSTVKEATSSIGKLGKEAFSTGLTLQDSFDRAKASFVNNFRAIGRKEAVAFVKDTTREFAAFNKNLKEIAADNGPMGMVVRKFSEMHQIGGLALLPKTLRPMAAVMGTMLAEMSPMIGMLGSLGFRLKMLASPFTLVLGAAAVLVGWFVKLRMEGKTTGQAFSEIGSAIKSAMPRVLAALSSVIDWISEVALPAIRNFGRGLLNGIFDGVVDNSESSAQNIGSQVGVTIRKAFEYAVQTVSAYLVGWWHRMTAIWSDSSKPFTEKIKETIGGSAGVILGAFALAKFTPVFSVLGGLIKFIAPIAQVAMSAVGPIVQLVSGIFSVTGAITAGIAAVGALFVGFLVWPEKTAEIVGKIGNHLRAGLAKVAEWVTEALFLVVKYTAGLAIVVAQNFSKILTALGQAIVGIVDWIQKAILGILDGIENWLVKKFPDAANIIHGVFDVIRGAVTVVFEAIKIAVNVVIGVFKVFGAVVEGVFRAIWFAIDTFLITPIKFVANIVGTVLSTAWKVFSTVVEGVWSVVGPIINGIGDAIGWVADKVRGVSDFVGGAIDAVGGFFSSVGDAFDAFSGPIGEAIAQVKKLDEESKKSTRSVTDVVTQSVAQLNAQFAQLQAQNANRAAALQQQIANGTVQTEQQKYAAMTVIQDAFVAQSRAVLQGIPDAMKDAATRAQGELNRAYFEQLRAITMNEEMNAADRKAALAALETWKVAKLAEYNAMVQEQQKLVAAGGDAALAQMTDSFTKFSEGITSKANESALKASGTVGSIQKELGVSAESALNHITSVANIDPRKFEANLKRIKESFIKFSKEIATAFQNAWDAALKATNAAMATIDLMLTSALLKLRGIAALMTSKFDVDRQERVQGKAQQKDIRALNNGERDQELLNATNWPLWYDDYRVQFSTLVMAVSGLAGSNPKGGRNTAAKPVTTAAPTGVGRGAR